MTKSKKTLQRLSKEQWQDLIAKQQSSEVNQSAFCRIHGLSLSTFSTWKRRLSSTVKPQSKASEFIDISDIASTPEPELQQPLWDIELELPGNLIFRMRR